MIYCNKKKKKTGRNKELLRTDNVRLLQTTFHSIPFLTTVSALYSGEKEAQGTTYQQASAYQYCQESAYQYCQAEQACQYWQASDCQAEQACQYWQASD
jgi:hypothetical protein